MRPAAKGWKGQSILVNRHLTSPMSPARAIGLMPSFAHHALGVVKAATRVAGMAKKRWRDSDPSRMTLEDVREMRQAMNASFDALEAALVQSTSADGTCVVDEASAARNYDQFGMTGITALALVEEAGELSDPLHALALGAAGVMNVQSAIRDEAADVRTWLHLLDTAMGIDPVSTTQDKWNRSLERMGRPAMEALAPRRLDQEQIQASMVALATRTKGS